MSRLVHRPITVTLRDDMPHSFVEGENTHVILHILDRWIESGDWIKGEPHHTVYQVTTTNYYLFDIEQVGSDWFIYRVWD